MKDSEFSEKDILILINGLKHLKCAGFEEFQGQLIKELSNVNNEKRKLLQNKIYPTFDEPENCGVIYRRKYECNKCGKRGKRSNSDRMNPFYNCPECNNIIKLQVQNESGIYESDEG